jgi:hypothetical protein
LDLGIKGDSMSLKEKFIDKLGTLVEEFESKTGVELKSIEFERLNVDSEDSLVNESIITKIELKMS